MHISAYKVTKLFAILQIFMYLCIVFFQIIDKYVFNTRKMTHLEQKQVRSLRLKKYRDELGLFVAEGDKCIGELLKSFELVHHLTPENTPLKEIERLSSLQTPQGSIAVFRKPAYANGWSASELQADCLYLALDDVQDPGNVGTIIRTADWFGVKHIICSEGTADCFAPKVVQATMGALARVQVHYLSSGDFCALLRGAAKAGIPVYGTLLDGEDIYSANAIADKSRGIIVMGNEGNGLSAAVRKCVTHRLRIPSYPANEPTSESLNVAIATAVTLAEFRREG